MPGSKTDNGIFGATYLSSDPSNISSLKWNPRSPCNFLVGRDAVATEDVESGMPP
jgi:hypothetical protein